MPTTQFFSESLPTPLLNVWRVLRFLGAMLIALPCSAAVTEKVVAKKMGSRFEITAVHASAEQAQAAIAAAYAEIDRLEAMMSSWQPTSATSEVNRMAGIAPVEVPQELFNLIRRCIKISQLTEGAFDITYDSFGKLWDFKSGSTTLPSDADIQAALTLVGFQKIQLDAQARTVFLPQSGMRIGFGAIGKGFAANKAAFILKDQGVTGGVINAGGDMVVFGRQADGALWQVGIAHPRKPDQVFAHLAISEQAIVTSGDYESFFIHEGKRYAHILNPKTGYPVDFLQSVTVICPNGELADALATSVFVLGREKGLALLSQLDQVEGLIIDADGHPWATPNLNVFTQEKSKE